MKPPTPEELGDGAELPAEGMMFVGDKGKVLAGFRGEAARVLSGSAKDSSDEAAPRPARRDRRVREEAWVAAVRGGTPTYGDFSLAGPISDAFNLGAVSLRMGGRRLLFDAAAAKVTNVPQANRYLTREYRQGWELTGA
jgi:hypothetical protein